MKIRFTSFVVILLLVSVGTNVFAQSQNDWEDPNITERNKLSPRVNVVPFGDIEVAKEGDIRQSGYYRTLNGDWKFKWSRNPAKRPADFYQDDFDASDWNEITVPGSWQMQEFGTLLYTNTAYPFEKDPPHIPSEYNPVGSYKTTFTIPKSWDSRDIVLHFGGVSSAMYVWVNGEKVGYSQDSKLPAEFDITPHLQDGENSLSVEVYRWSDGSYLEDQDMWRMSGLQRDVYLYSKPNFNISDYHVDASLDSDFKNGILDLQITIENNLGGTQKGEVSYQVLDADGNSIASDDQLVSLDGGSLSTVSFSKRIDNIKQWSAEIPNLYTLLLKVSGEQSEYRETLSHQVGFRTVEISDGQLQVNGEPVLLKGVNRHEHDMEKGHTMSRRDMLEDIKKMKRANINAVRTSHYPHDPYFYKLADKYGLYVVDEANIESHGMGVYDYPEYGYRMSSKLAEDPQWEKAHLERISRMVERDRNHASVIIWSMGNEAGAGETFDKGYDMIHEMDGSRPVQYEQAWKDDYTDIVAPMYHRVHEMEAFVESGDPRPMILCEYSHSMGNSTGNLVDYWNLIESHKQLQGGFIWDWKDQGILNELPDGSTHWAYGGAFGPEDTPSDGPFALNGLLFTDGSPTPALKEVKKVYQYIKFLPKDLKDGVITIDNRYQFTGSDEFTFHWQILENGVNIKEGTLVLDNPIKAGEKQDVTIPVNEISVDYSKEYFLNLYAKKRQGSELIEAGYTLAKEQFLLPFELDKPNFTDIEGELSLHESDNEIRIENDDFTIIFDRPKGFLKTYVFQSQHLVQDGLKPNFWRAPTSNDAGDGLPKRASIWNNIEQHRKLTNIDTKTGPDGEIMISTESVFENSESSFDADYTIYGDGTIKVEASFKAAADSLPELPRFGMSMELPGEFKKLEWLGRGPHENYADRKTSAFVGRYSGTVSEQFVPYMTPQENGNKTGVRWVRLQNDQQMGLMVKSLSAPLNINAHHYRTEDLEGNLDYYYQVPTRDLVELHIDYKQRGVGGDNSWGNMPLDKYRLLDDSYSYDFILKPISK